MEKEYLEEREMRNSGNINFSQKYSLALILFLIVPGFLHAQRFEVGLAAGGGNYIGDMNPTYRLENYRPAGGLFGRYNFNKVVSAKLFVNGVQAKGSDRFYNDPFPQIRQLHFIRTLVEFGGQFEYNFFNYRDEKSRRNWTPYFFAGIAGMYMFDQEGVSSGKTKSLQPVIPTGVGFKYFWGSQWNLGLELGARKTFTDYFDHLSADDPDKFRKGNEFSRDWYFVTTLSISYTFYSIPCPFNNYD